MAHLRGAALALISTLCVAGAAHAGTQLLTYQGPDAIKQGQGGSMKAVDGVDFWLEGSPPHRFQIIGVLDDERLKTGIIGFLRMSSLEHDLARMAHQAGGDAVILTAAHDNLKAVVGSSFGNAYGNAYGNSFSAWGSASSYTAPVESRASRYVVVKYLPDGDAPAWSSGPPAQMQEPAAGGGYAARF